MGVNKKHKMATIFKVVTYHWVWSGYGR